MPKLQRNERQEKGGHLVGVIKKYLEVSGMTVTALAKRIGIAESTMYYRLKNPEKFPWWELYMAFKILKVPAEEIVECFPGELKPVNVNVVLTSEAIGKEVGYVRQ